MFAVAACSLKYRRYQEEVVVMLVTGIEFDLGFMFQVYSQEELCVRYG